MSTMTKAADRGIRPVGSVIVASGAAASAAVWYHLAQGVTISLGACILLLPVWWATLSRYRGATPLVVVGLLAMVSGLLLGRVDQEGAGWPAAVSCAGEWACEDPGAAYRGLPELAGGGRSSTAGARLDRTGRCSGGVRVDPHRG